MKVLVVVDMQNDFISGSLGTPEAQAIVPNVKKKVAEAVANGDLIIYTRDTHFEDYLNTKEGKALPVPHCIFQSDGWQIPRDLLPPEDYENYRIHDKYTFGSIHLPPVLGHYKATIHDFDEVELCGLCTDICVISNALLIKASYYNALDISVDAACCAGVTPESHEAALKTMEMCQINVKRR